MFVRQTSPGPFAELTTVTVLRSVSTDAGVMKCAGSTGVVVGIWADGKAYEVEFAEPQGALATIKAGDLRLA